MFGRLKSFTVHVPETANEALPVLVKEGFSWSACFFGLLWVLYQRLWIPALLIVAVNMLIALTGRVLDLPSGALAAGQVGVLLVIGCFAYDWQRAALSKRGYALADIVAAPNEGQALLRYVDQASTVPSH